VPLIPDPPESATAFDPDSSRVADSPDIADADESVAPEISAPASKTGRRRGLLIVVCLLVMVLLGALATGTWLFIQLSEAREHIDEQNDQIEQQNDQIEEQREQIDKKESFGAAMASLQQTIAPLAGLPFADLVPWSDYDILAARAWSHRRDLVAMDRDIEAVNEATKRIAEMREAARVEASANASGSVWEGTLDQLGSGWVTTSIEDASSTCDGDALACVDSADPLVVHVNASTGADPTMTDWIRTGVAHHEFAHVLQNMNYDATAPALAAFGGDWETMADCYSLTILPGWSLNHDVPINADEYWEVDVGYGYTCNESQRQTIREWLSQLGIVPRAIGG